MQDTAGIGLRDHIGGEGASQTGVLSQIFRQMNLDPVKGGGVFDNFGEDFDLINLGQALGGCIRPEKDNIALLIHDRIVVVSGCQAEHLTGIAGEVEIGQSEMHVVSLILVELRQIKGSFHLHGIEHRAGRRQREKPQQD